MKILIYMFLFITYSFAHPVNYTIDLTVNYDKISKTAQITCISSSRNKCGAYNFHLVNKNDKIIKTSRFPFLKKEKTVKIEKAPYKMIFFLKKIPEHQYIVYLKPIT